MPKLSINISRQSSEAEKELVIETFIMKYAG